MSTIKVTNRSRSTVAYPVPDSNMVRSFAPGETKTLNAEEIISLSGQPGGRNLIMNYLLVDNMDILNEASIPEPEQEYWYTNEFLNNWITNCSLDEFKDALDFAPDGVKEVIKDLAVHLPLNDVAKRAAIKEQLGFNVDFAVESLKPEEGEEVATSNSKRRVKADPEYKIVNMQK